MELKIPFINKTITIGKSAPTGDNRARVYASWQNLLSDAFYAGSMRISFDTLYMIYNNVVDVKQSIRKIQNAVMKSGYHFVNKWNPEAKPNEAQVKYATDFLEGRLVSDGKPFATTKDLWVRDICIAGNSYILKLKNAGKKFIGLQIADPRTMAIIADEYGNVKKFIQRVMGYESISFEKDEVVHSVMDYSTTNTILGVSPIEAIIWEAKAEMSASLTNYNFYENNAVPAHLFILEEELTEKQYITLKDEIDKQFKGSKNSFKSGLIPYVKDIKTITPSQKDMQYIETRKFTTKKVVVAFGVDAFILGYTEGIQRGNSDTIYSMFYNETIRPYEIYLEQQINNFILPFIDCPDIELRIIESNYENEYRIADITRADVNAGILTINEARKRRGLDKLDNELADEPLYNGMLLDDLNRETEQVIQEVKELIAKKKIKIQKKAESFKNLLDETAK